MTATNNDLDTRHNFGPIQVEDNGFDGEFLFIECSDCDASVGGDKESDLYDVDEWAGVCPGVSKAVEELTLTEAIPLTHNPFYDFAVDIGVMVEF